MEKHINRCIETYTTQFKDDLKNKIVELNFQEKQKTNELVEFLYDYTRLTFKKNELSKKKRTKNSIPPPYRCIAKRANGEQCTRRKKENCEFCGTHSKGTPQGLFQKKDSVNKESNENIEVLVEEIKGIVYYIDKFNNVYKTEDILEGRENPRIIAKCVRENGKCTIPELGLL